MQAHDMLAHMTEYVRNNPIAIKLAEKYAAQEMRTLSAGERCPRCDSRISFDGRCQKCGYSMSTTDICSDCGGRYSLIKLSEGLCPSCGLEKELVIKGIFTEAGKEEMPGLHNFKAGKLGWIEALPAEIREAVEQEYYVNPDFAQHMAAKCCSMAEIRELRKTYHQYATLPKQSMLVELIEQYGDNENKRQKEARMGWLDERMNENGVRIRLLNRKQVAELFSVSPTTVDNWRTEGLIPYYRLGKNKVGFDPADVEAMAEKMKQQ